MRSTYKYEIVCLRCVYVCVCKRIVDVGGCIVHPVHRSPIFGEHEEEKHTHSTNE
jgi:hypothetical protein